MLMIALDTVLLFGLTARWSQVNRETVAHQLGINSPDRPVSESQPRE